MFYKFHSTQIYIQSKKLNFLVLSSLALYLRSFCINSPKLFPKVNLF